MVWLRGTDLAKRPRTGNFVDDEGATALAEAWKSCSELRVVNLYSTFQVVAWPMRERIAADVVRGEADNNVGAAGASALADASQQWPHLQKFYLACTIVALARTTPCVASLTLLCIAWCVVNTMCCLCGAANGVLHKACVVSILTDLQACNHLETLALGDCTLPDTTQHAKGYEALVAHQFLNNHHNSDQRVMQGAGRADSGAKHKAVRRADHSKARYCSAATEPSAAPQYKHEKQLTLVIMGGDDAATETIADDTALALGQAFTKSEVRRSTLSMVCKVTPRKQWGLPVRVGRLTTLARAHDLQATRCVATNC